MKNICNKPGCEEPKMKKYNSKLYWRYCPEHQVESTVAKVRVLKNKLDRSNFKTKKESLRSKSYFEKLLQTEINSIVRLIDIDKGCISCDHGWGKPATRQFHAGHRLSIGSNPALRFNLFNIYRQCSVCNNYLSGNERAFDKGILFIYGSDMLDTIKSLSSKYKALNLSIEDLKEKIILSKKAIKDILSGKDYSRKEINESICIYEIKD